MRVGKQTLLLCRIFLIINLILSLVALVAGLILGKTLASGYGIFLVLILMVFTAVGTFSNISGPANMLSPEVQSYLLIAFFIAYSVFLVFALYVVLFAPAKPGVRQTERTPGGRTLSDFSTMGGMCSAAVIWFFFFPAMIKGENRSKKEDKVKQAQIEKIYSTLQANNGFKISAADGSTASTDCGVVAMHTPVGRMVLINTQHDENKTCPAFYKKVTESLEKNENVEYRLPPKSVFFQHAEINPDDPGRLTLFGKITVNGEELPQE